MRLLLLRCMILAGSLRAIQAFQTLSPPCCAGFTRATTRTSRRPRPRDIILCRPSLPLSIPVAATSTTSRTQLRAFLPPGGGNNRSGGLGQVATAALTFLAVVAFFLSPLGALFFAVFNSLVALSILIPVGAFVAFQIWQYFYTVKGPCPNCAAPCQVTKDGAPSICFNCGAIVQARGDDIYLANPNNNGDMFVEDDDVVTSWFDELSGRGRTPPGTTTVRKTTTTIIDVDAKDDD